ncbi:hypothetical protein OEW28_06955 [Defluviimonas sp. WL0002]|uniref:Entericidin EcnA/B family protein n=1 Tax=Albidovulum marisflavi TaxID=2984159 RepID=A0ABT2ZB42_9RHOB|nr:hypothetical protein [Defluviimonas sp. WL0002]MCV2868365.1 hypothetical protein [Defluviimonas sp. WL0002]
MAPMRLILMMVMLSALSGCGAVVVGAGGAVLADQVVEDQEGGDGLF